ncbi:hypothetical protein ARMGADRAFT_1026246 [Armillaria gallica]|uniref:Uncharacterized protein n=1 Tax=Armillaria gallica TaxID=47427 RepID=A0A2H3DSF3_ARMGA|nr:hypothetical protein ARMGADRAFT_1026246 [Armillaria gallica]
MHQKQLLEAFQQAKNTGPQQSNSCNNGSRSASANDVCWYDCILGHYAKDCKQTKKHIVEGLLKIVNGKIIMSDGSPVPSQLAQKALFEWVIEYFTNCSRIIIKLHSKYDNLLIKIMLGLMNQLSNSNGSNSQQPAENSQFMATQMGAGANQPDF